VFEALLEKIARGLDEKNVPYMVIGGQAVLLYGEPRLTRDIDITLGAGVERLDEMMGIVDRIDLKCLTPKVEDFVRETMVLPAIEEKTGIRVDFIFSFSPYERQAIERAKGVSLGNSKVRFAALEDVVIHKIIAGRPRDIEDVENILLKNPEYDSSYIEKWLAEFDEALNEDYRRSFTAIRKRIE
jgi:predicted nucleotidyltransferase